MEEIQDTQAARIVETVSGKIENWIGSFIELLPNMAIALILFIIFILLAKVFKRLFIKIFKKSSDNLALQNLFGSIIYYAVMGAGLFIILEVLHLGKAVTSLLAGVGVIGLALGFAFQDIVANFVSGIILAFRKPFRVGDIIKINDFMGSVTRTNLRVTVIRTFQGQEVYLPNKDVLQSPIINFTVLGERRIDLAVGVSYGDNLEKVQKIVLDALNDVKGVIRKDEMIFTYTAFGDSSINFEIKFWIKYPDDPGFLAIRTAAIIAIKSAFDKNNITIPFPIRTLDFGIKGGEKLSEMNLNVAERKAS